MFWRGLEKPGGNVNCRDMNQNAELQSFDVIVVGGGPAGLAAAIAVAVTGARTALVALRAPYADNRTTALLGDSVDLLDRLDVWRRCSGKAAALRVMRLVDDTGRLIRAPEVRFASAEIGMEAFGFNIENRNLMVALEARAAELPNLVRYDDEASSVAPDEAAATVHTRQGATLSAPLLIGADGRKSPCRQAAGIEVKSRALNQSALTFNVAIARPHQNSSTEFHTARGPCVFVPLPGNRCSVVWVSAPKEAERLMALGDDDLAAAAERQSHSIFGRVTLEPGRNLFPLAIEQPKHFAARRIALVGEAAHVVPPIGAQGLNMGLRDAGDIADIVRDTLARGDDLGSAEVMTKFERARRADVSSRTFAIDIANRSLLSELLPVQAARAVGMHLIGALGPLRRLAMREGLSPSWRSL
jgi:2-octaprenyl-6-methoxyphenol hydroxylase